MKDEMNGEELKEPEELEPPEPEPSDERIPPEIKKQIETFQKKSEELLSRLIRLQADFENYKKRSAKEREEIISLATERLVKELLVLVDDFERALSSTKDNCEELLDQGMEMIYKNLKDILRREGVSEIQTKCKLDPFKHEVISKVDDPSMEEGDIIECLQKGYMMGRKVIRPARVVVCMRESPERMEKKNGEESNHDHDLMTCEDNDKEVS